MCTGLKAVCILLVLAGATRGQRIQPNPASALHAARTACTTDARERELFDAIERRDSARVEAFLAAGVSHNARARINPDSGRPQDAICAPALLHAAWLGDARTVGVLLAAKADVNASDEWGRLVWAYAFGEYAIKRLNPAQLPEEMSARLEITESLLAAGANPNGKDEGSLRALSHAVDAGVLSGDPRIVKALLSRGAAVNVKGDSILAYATYHRRQAAEIAETKVGGVAPRAEAVIETLIKAGADVNASMYGSNETALMIEAGAWRLEGVTRRLKVLLDAGADVNAQAEPTGATPLLSALKVYFSYSYGESKSGRDYAEVMRDRVEVVKLLLAAGADPNRKDKVGDTPLPSHFSPYMATLYPAEYDALLKALLDAGADINSRDSQGRTLLALVASSRYVDDYLDTYEKSRMRLLKTLIAAGADVNAKDSENQTSLLATIKSYPKKEIILTLLAAGADARAPDVQGRTPLMEIIRDYRSIDPEIVKALLDAGADARARDKEGSTALLLNLSDGWLSSVTRLLIDAGADVNTPDKNGMTPLTAAVTSTLRRSIGLYNDSAKMIEMLVAAKADVNARSAGGDTALMAAVRLDREDEVIQTMLAARADVNAANDSGDTALIIAAERYNVTGAHAYYSYKPRDSILKALLAAGADVKAVNRDGESALTIMAAKAGAEALPIVRALVESGRRTHPRAVDLLAAIRRAAGRSTSDIVQELIAAGADVNATDEDGRPALIVAAGESGNAGVVRALLKAGARVNASDADGDTALTAAVREYLPGGDEPVRKALHRDPEVIRALLDAGADAKLRGRDGRTALSLALESGNRDLIGLLEAAGAAGKR